ncbi:MAG: class I SAM-dependent methyltransferase [Acetivibrionales bacterium]
MNNREYFNSLAEKWDTIVNHDEGKIRYIVATAGISEGQKVLDVGTGTGVMIPFLHSCIGDKGEIIAVDVSEKMVEQAKNKFSFKNVQFIVGDVLEADLPENYFDCIMCYSMFPHFSDKKYAVERLSGYLKKNGKFVICHSQSREAINKIHKDASHHVKDDRLPAANVIKEYYKNANIQTVTIVDNEELFIVVGIKE